MPSAEHWSPRANGNGNMSELGTARGAGEPSGRDRSCDLQSNGLDQPGQFLLVLAALMDGLIRIKQMSENSLASERCVGGAEGSASRWDGRGTHSVPCPLLTWDSLQAFPHPRG